MVQIYRESELNYKSVFENIVTGLRAYCDHYGIKTLVLGCSGGIDSTVVAAIAKASGLKLIGVSLPCSTNEECENEAARLVGEEFCDEFKVVNLQSTFEVMEKFCQETSGIESTPISQGNIKARLRMITLYDIASKVGGIVLDSDNLTEYWLSFFTIHGDECDFNPIGGLWKTEVYELARYLLLYVYEHSKALELSISLTPTDGNGVAAGGDLAQIAPGYTYDDVDHILQRWVGLDSRIKKDILKKGVTRSSLGIGNHLYDDETVKKVIMRSVNSGFKRAKRPFVVDIYRGLVTDKDGSIVSL